MQSSVCHLRGLNQKQLVAAKEEATEMGGSVPFPAFDAFEFRSLIGLVSKCTIWHYNV